MCCVICYHRLRWCRRVSWMVRILGVLIQVTVRTGNIVTRLVRIEWIHHLCVSLKRKQKGRRTRDERMMLKRSHGDRSAISKLGVGQMTSLCTCYGRLSRKLNSWGIVVLKADASGPVEHGTKSIYLIFYIGNVTVL